MVEITSRTLIRAPRTRCFNLARSVEVHSKGNIHWGEEAVATGGVTTGLIGLGEFVTWRARHLGVRQRLTSEITAFDQPCYFQDTMRRGAFQFMQHDHYFREISPIATEMIDVFRFAAPVPIVGLLTERLFLRRYMRSLLEERNAAIKEIAESGEWMRYLPAEAHL